MRDDRIYQLRRAILTALKDSNPAPRSLAEILCHPEFGMLHASAGEAAGELEALAVKGYVRNVAGSNGEYKAITGPGLDQINQEVDRDTFVWGKYGLR